MNNFQITVNPDSGKILIGSTHGSIMDALDMAVTYLNDPAYKNRDIEVYCDGGRTAIELPAGKRNASYTADDLWDMVCKQRADNAAAWRRDNPLSP